MESFLLIEKEAFFLTDEEYLCSKVQNVLMNYAHWGNFSRFHRQAVACKNCLTSVACMEHALEMKVNIRALKKKKPELEVNKFLVDWEMFFFKEQSPV